KRPPRVAGHVSRRMRSRGWRRTPATCRSPRSRRRSGSCSSSPRRAPPITSSSRRGSPTKSMPVRSAECSRRSSSGTRPSAPRFTTAAAGRCNGRARLRLVDAAGWSEERLRSAVEDEAHRPFDLARGPVLRAVLFQRPCRKDRESVLLLAVHHLVFDGWSLWRLLGELALLYRADRLGVAAELEPLRHAYPDFVRWQRALLASDAGERLWERWQPRLAGVPPLELPVDRPRQPAARRTGGSHAFRIGADRVRELRALAARHGTTLFAVVLAAFEALLGRYTGQEEMLIGVAAAG